MGYKIEEIEGIGPSFAGKLAKANIKTTDDLLKQCANGKGRKTTSETTGIGEKVLLGWANKADLMRVKGIGSEYSDLLEASGVDTIKELRNRKAGNLAAKMKEVNTAKKLARTVPSEKSVADWIEQAGKLTPMITH